MMLSFFGSCITDILNTGCAKILKKIPAPKGQRMNEPATGVRVFKELLLDVGVRGCPSPVRHDLRKPLLET